MCCCCDFFFFFFSKLNSAIYSALEVSHSGFCFRGGMCRLQNDQEHLLQALQSKVLCVCVMVMPFQIFINSAVPIVVG